MSFADDLSQVCVFYICSGGVRMKLFRLDIFLDGGKILKDARKHPNILFYKIFIILGGSIRVLGAKCQEGRFLGEVCIRGNNGI